MDEQARDQAFFSALTTEHFVLQSVSSTTVSESSSRASLYLMALSSSLVAIGFAVGVPGAFEPFAGVVLPAIFVLGLFTTVRLVDTAVENIQAQRTIARIRQHYAELGPEAARFFGPTRPVLSEQALDMIGVRPGPFLLLFTMASTIGAVNALVGRVIVALAIVAVAGSGAAISAVAIGIAVAAILVLLTVLYQRRRFRLMDRADQARWGTPGDG